MNFSEPLQSTKLLKRYKRFLADVIHPTLGPMTVHCPNTGSMKNCWGEGWVAWILDSHNDKRKYQFTWVISESPDGDLIGINTHFANQIVYEGILANKVPELQVTGEIQREVRYGEENSRIDILLTDESESKTFVEVKSVTLLETDGIGYFPDAVTTRGQKHLRELIHCAEAGHRSVLFYLVQHSGIRQVAIANHIDTAYGELFQLAIKAGVEVLIYGCHLNSESISLSDSIPLLI